MLLTFATRPCASWCRAVSLSRRAVPHRLGRLHWTGPPAAADRDSPSSQPPSQPPISYSSFRDGDIDGDGDVHDAAAPAAPAAPSVAVDPTALEFREADHSYHYRGERVPVSVTQLVASFFDAFDADEAAAALLRSANWPRPEYTHPDGSAFTKDEILARWDAVGLEARTVGTRLHALVERFFDAADPSAATPPPLLFAPDDEEADETPETLRAEMAQLRSFAWSFLRPKRVRPVATELRLVAPDVGVAGSVDFVGELLPPAGYRGPPRHVLIDWKRSKNMAQAAFAAFGATGRGPLRHVAACDGFKYALQLNLYRHVLERYYGVHVAEMYVVSLHAAQTLPAAHHAPTAPLPPTLAPPATLPTRCFYETMPPLPPPTAAVADADADPTAAAVVGGGEFRGRRYANVQPPPPPPPPSPSPVPLVDNAALFAPATAADAAEAPTGFYVLQVADLRAEVEAMLAPLRPPSPR
eukprot:gene8323-6003_t